MSENIAAFSYSIAALGFLFLSLLLLTAWRDRLHHGLLAGACLTTSLWAMTVAWHAFTGRLPLLVVDVLEIFRNVGWCVFLLTILGQLRPSSKMVASKSSVLLIAAAFLLLVFSTVYSHWQSAFYYGAPGFTASIVGRTALAVLGMLLVEQVYRNTPNETRWGIKFACLGMGGLFAYDFYLYSDAMLFRRISPDIWTARGFADALTVPFIALSTARNPQWNLGVSVSRRVLYHSAALFGSAIYLLAMAGAGYYLRLFGGSWGMVMQAVFLFGAAALLLVVLFSGAVRSWLKVSISKHFFRYHYDYRDEWLRFTRALSVQGPGLKVRTIQAVAQLMESPAGALFIRTESGNCEPAANWNMGAAQEPEPVDSPFCRFLETKQWVVDLEECQSSPSQYEQLALPGWLEKIPQAWLVVPLILHGRLFGFIVLARPRSRMKLNWEATDLLKIAGSQAASYLAQQESTNALMVARQFESFNRMSTFLVHDLKNLISQLSLMLSNAQKHRDNVEFQQDMLETVDYSVQKMKMLLHKLSRVSAEENPAVLFVDEVLRRAVALKSAAEPRPTLEIRDHRLTVFADPSRLERVIGHLIQNAIEATPKHGRVTIRLGKQDGEAHIEVEDTGQGMSNEFIRERLFKPFESTKSAGMGIGVFESRAYIQEIGGRIEVASRCSVGTTFRVKLPLHHFEALSIERAA